MSRDPHCCGRHADEADINTYNDAVALRKINMVTAALKKNVVDTDAPLSYRVFQKLVANWRQDTRDEIQV